MDDLSSPGGSTFHTPEQHLPPCGGTPTTTSAAAATSLPISTAGKKRSADDVIAADNDNAAQQQSPSLLGRLISSVTPSRMWSKRSRSSLDGMSGSAIKSANRDPSSAAGNGGASAPAYKLPHLNLEKKLNDISPMNTTNNSGGMPVQEAIGSSGSGLMEQNMPVKKRVRLGGASTFTSSNSNQRPSAATTTAATTPATKTVRIGGTTSFATSPYNAFTASASTASAGSTPAGGLKFNVGSATKPTFQMGSSASKSKPTLRDVRGRMSTPGGKFMASARRSAGSTPGLARGGTRTATATAGGLTAAGRSLTTQRTSATSSLLSSRRGVGYRRRPLIAKGFKPMSRLLTGVYSGPSSQRTASNNTTAQSMMINESIVTQILEDSRNKLGLVDVNQERALFGGNAAKSGDVAVDSARTFAEEEGAYSAVTSATASAPRVRMNRIFGKGQTGGCRFALEPPSTSTSLSTVAGGVGGTVNAAPAPLFGQHASSTAAAKRAVTFQSPQSAAKSDVEMDDVDDNEPYSGDSLQQRGSSDTKLTPCNPTDNNMTKKLGSDIESMAKSPEWKRKVSVSKRGYDDLNVTTPRPLNGGKKDGGKKAVKGTPHPNKKMAALSKAMNTAATASSSGGSSGAPYSFMPGGAAASSTVSTPMAFNYGKAKSDPPQSTEQSSAAKPPAPAASASPAPVAGGWGNLFKDPPGTWKCDTCSTKNPPDKTACMACEVAKPGADTTSSGASSGEGATTNGSKPSAGSIGAAGFSFGGGTASSTTATSSTTTTPSGWGDMFKPKEGEWKCTQCMVKNKKGDSECVACEAPKEGGGGNSSGGVSSSLGTATPAKSKRKVDDGKASIGAGGFSFGGAASSTTMASSSTLGGASTGSGGFSFGGAASGAAGAATTPAKSKRGRDDVKEESTSKPAVGGFMFGAGAAAAPSSSVSTKPSSSAGFSFGLTPASDEKKEDSASGAATSGFSFSAKAPVPASSEKNGGGASIPGFSFGTAPTPSVSADKKDETAEPLTKKRAPAFSFGKGGSAPSLPMPSANGATPAAPGTAGFLFGSTPAKPTESAASGTPAFSFGSSAPAPATETKTAAPSTGTPAFAFGSSTTPAPAPSASSTFGGFSTGGAASTTPANPPASTGASFSFGAGGTTTSATTSTGFASTPAPTPAAGGFGGNASFGGATAAAPPASTGTSFSFGVGGTAAPPSTGFASTPAPTPGFGGNASFGGATAAPSTAAPAFGFGSAAPAANPSGFAPAAPGGFGANASFAAAPPAAAPAAGVGGGFAIGTGGSKTNTKGRRILKARRPPGTR